MTAPFTPDVVRAENLQVDDLLAGDRRGRVSAVSRTDDGQMLVEIDRWNLIAWSASEPIDIVPRDILAGDPFLGLTEAN